MARDERSAGFVIFAQRDAGAARKYLLLDYGRHWDYPKGHVEAGEDTLGAATRELREETGISRIEIIPGFEHAIQYFFRSRDKGLIRKQVTFFLARTSELNVLLSHEHIGYAFLTYEAAMRRLTFATARQVLEAAEAFLADHTPSN